MHSHSILTYPRLAALGWDTEDKPKSSRQDSEFAAVLE